MLLGKYRVLRCVGSGAMGNVYEAADGSARVAVKVLHPELAEDADVRRRFQREATVLRALDAPGIVRTLERSTEEDGRLFLVMELLEGESLRARRDRGEPSSDALILRWISEAAEALDHAHARGIVHGDLKPENVFLEGPAAGPRVKLLDFGMAKVVGLERLTRTGEIAGTPVYMAPELIMGTGDIDGRSDVYALGIVAYEQLAGRHPFAAKHAAKMLTEIVAGARVPLATHRPGTTADLEAAFARALAARPSDRFPSAGEFTRALTAALAPLAASHDAGSR